MKRSTALFLLGGLALAGAGALLWTGKRGAGEEGFLLGGGDIATGKLLYAENCAACHGANLEGQANWQTPLSDGRLPAPPHDESGHTWHHGDQMLFDYTKLGGQAVLEAQGVSFDSGMPGFADQLSDEDIHAILAYIRSTWPEPIRKMQRERTKLEAGG